MGKFTDSGGGKRRAFTLLTAFLLVISFLPLITITTSEPVRASPGPDWYNSNWTYRKQITIDNTKVENENFADFPVLIQTTLDNSKTMDNGDDILFTASNGTTKLNHEIEKFDTENLIAWVKIPTLYDNENTIIYMYYGNASASNQENVTGVWDDNFVMVQHLDDNSTSTTLDSTQYTNHGVKEAANQPVECDGKIGKGQDFNLHHIVVAHDTELSITGTITISLWLQHHSGDYFFVSSKLSIYEWEFYFTVKDDLVGMYRGSSIPDRETYVMPIDTWVHVVAVDDLTNFHVYVNGETLGSSSSVVASSGTSDVVISGRLDGSYEIVGKMDEFRISNVPRSANWILTTFNNENNPSSFYSVGTEESAVINVAPNKPTNLQPSTRQISTSVTISADVTDNDGDNMNVYFYDNSDNSTIDNIWAENGTTAQVAWSSLTRGNTYTFFVGIQDNNDAWGENSDTQSFVITVDYASKGVDYLHHGVAAIDNEPEFVFLWRANILSTYDEFSAPIAVGNKVWIANKGDNIFRCLYMENGSEIWSYQLNTGTDGASLWYDNEVYVATGCGASSEYGNLYAFNADNGDLLWQENGINNTSFAAGIWFNEDNDYLYWKDGQYLRCLNADNGDIIWSTDTGQDSAPYTGVYYNGITYTPELIRAYDAENGDLLWSIDGTVWDSGITVDDENVDNVVLYVCQSGYRTAKIWAVNPENGDNYWIANIRQSPASGAYTYLLGIPAVWDNKVYVTGAPPYISTITCLNKENGDIIWEKEYNGSISYTSPTILPSGKVVYASQDGLLKVRDADNGDLLWSYSIGMNYSGQVAIVDNYMFVTSDSGHLYAFGAGNVPSSSPTELLTEGQTNPTQITDLLPEFTAIFTDNDLGDFTESAQVWIGSTQGENDIWVSNWSSITTTENNQRSSDMESIGRVLENFENIDDWTHTGTDWAELDDSWKTGGTYSAMIVLEKPNANDYSQIERNFDLTNIDELKVDLSGSVGFKRYFKVFIDGDTIYSVTNDSISGTLTIDTSSYTGNCAIKFQLLSQLKLTGTYYAWVDTLRTEFTRGTTYYWQCRFTDNAGNIGAWSTETATFKINQLPTGPVVDITPDPALTDDDLTCNITTESTDADGDSITYFYQWYKNWAVQSGENDNTLSSSLTTRDENWLCVVTPNDGYENGPSDNDSVVIQNYAPTCTITAPSDGLDELINVGIAFTATGSDNDGDALSYSWSFGDGAGTSTEQNPAYQYSNPGDFVVVLTVSDGTDTDNDSIVVNIFSPSGPGAPGWVPPEEPPPEEPPTVVGIPRSAVPIAAGWGVLLAVCAIYLSSIKMGPRRRRWTLNITKFIIPMGAFLTLLYCRGEGIILAPVMLVAGAWILAFSIAFFSLTSLEHGPKRRGLTKQFTKWVVPTLAAITLILVWKGMI